MSNTKSKKIVWIVAIGLPDSEISRKSFLSEKEARKYYDSCWSAPYRHIGYVYED
mgnify:CR=1 FL=1